MDDRSEHEAANARKWSTRAETFDRRRFDYFRWMQKRTLSFAEVSVGAHLLDIGCGTGFAVRHIAAKLQDQGVFCGVNLAPRMIEMARDASDGLQNVRFEVASAEQLPYLDEYFDVILCTNSFHHYLNPSTALAEMHRVLRSGGHVFVVDVTADNVFIAWVDRKVRQKEAEHVKFYSSAEYRDMMDRASLRYLRTRTILPPVKVHIATK